MAHALAKTIARRERVLHLGRVPRPLTEAARAAGMAWQAWYDGLHLARYATGHGPAVIRGKHYIDRQFVEGASLDAIAAEARMSKFHFVRAFRDIFRQTPHRYLVARRITRARELLERTDLSVTAVCFEVGFESLGSFVARFRQIVGEPPSRYRQRFSQRGSVFERPVPACLYEVFTRRPPRPSGSTEDRNFEEA